MVQRLRFVKLHPNAILPKRAEPGSVGYDLHCVHDFTLRLHEQQRIRLGFACAVPVGFYGKLSPRSGLADRIGLEILAGVIDPSYRDEWQIILRMSKRNQNAGWDFHSFKAGDRIAQLIVHACATPDAEDWVDSLEATDRKGGFGSTGV